MTKIKPFRAIRPTRDKAHLVVTKPVSSYSKTVLKARLESNPFTFIRIIHPEFDKSVKTAPNSKERFELVRKKYHEFINEGILFQDEKPSIYIYRQTTPTNEFIGVIGGASVDEYNKDLIKKHEATLTSRESMFTNYLDIVGYNAEPVLLSYPHNEDLENIYAEITKERPEIEFSTTDRIKHELWIVSEPHQKAIEKAFDKIPATYIADGHHRSASSSRLANERNQNSENKYQNHDFFLAFFMDEKRMHILEFNRLVDHLNNLTETEFLAKLNHSFLVKPLTKSQKPSSEHQMIMNLKNQWFELICKPEIINNDDPVACLDAEILTNYILKPILGIEDLKTDESIHFIPGNLGIEAITEPIKQGKSKVGFFLFPVTMEQVIRVADNNGIMPPKSTYVEPKLRSGLTIYEI
ncbi:MAG: DUF1015 domain-containing protein [Crocinitomicaceae bacterium]|jgi:uncharacterized protein (DUF1015 family)